MTISREGSIISLHVNKREFDLLHAVVSNSKADYMGDFECVMDNYYHTYER